MYGHNDIFQPVEKKSRWRCVCRADRRTPGTCCYVQGSERDICDSIGLVNGTSGDVSTFDGYFNTVAMYNSYVEETGKGSPLAMKMMDFHENGQSDFIPSVAEQRLLVAAARQINPIIERFGGTPIALNGDCWYWTSTEVTENAGLQAWLCSAVNGGILPTPKTESHKARAVVEIHYPE